MEGGGSAAAVSDGYVAKARHWLVEHKLRAVGELRPSWALPPLTLHNNALAVQHFLSTFWGARAPGLTRTRISSLGSAEGGAAIHAIDLSGHVSERFAMNSFSLQPFNEYLFSFLTL